MRQNFFRTHLGSNVVIGVTQLIQLLLQSDGCVVGTEDFGSQAWHQRAEILVQDGSVETVEQVVTLLLALHEQLQVLEDALLHLDVVVVPDGVLTEEIKLDDILLAWKIKLQISKGLSKLVLT